VCVRVTDFIHACVNCVQYLCDKTEIWQNIQGNPYKFTISLKRVEEQEHIDSSAKNEQKCDKLIETWQWKEYEYVKYYKCIYLPDSGVVLGCGFQSTTLITLLFDGPSFSTLWECVPPCIPLHVHIVPNVISLSIYVWSHKSKSLHLLEDIQNQPILRFLCLCHMIGRVEFVVISFLYIPSCTSSFLSLV